MSWKNSPCKIHKSNKSLGYEEEFENTKGVIRIHKSKDRQHNGQKKLDKKDKQ